MRIDEPRQYGRRTEIDELGVGGDRRRTGIENPGDYIAANDDGDVTSRRRAGAVDQEPDAQDDRPRR
jgi:hypothetical protein